MTAHEPTPGQVTASAASRDGDGQPVVPDIGALVARHYAEVYRYAYRLAGDASDAEDLVQQTFLLAQQKLSQVREPAKVRGWLFAVLRSCYQKLCRRRRPVPAVDVGLEVDNVAHPLPDAALLDSDDLQRALAQLSDEHRSILLLFYFEQHSYKEIAADLDIPLGTVMSRLSRAKALLRQQLSAGQEEPSRRPPR